MILPGAPQLRTLGVVVNAQLRRIHTFPPVRFCSVGQKLKNSFKLCTNSDPIEPCW